MNVIVYIIICVLQPICWPLPEMSTIIYGTLTLGENKAFLIGYLGILIGIMIMYKSSFYLSEKYLEKLKTKKSFLKYKKYIDKNEVLTTGVLFILPILPDEIICIGAAILGIKLKIVMAVAIFAKFISIGIVAYSNTLSQTLNIPQSVIIFMELLIIFVASYIYKNYKEKIEKKNEQLLESR